MGKGSRSVVLRFCEVAGRGETHHIGINQSCGFGFLAPGLVGQEFLSPGDSEQQEVAAQKPHPPSAYRHNLLRHSGMCWSGHPFLPSPVRLLYYQICMPGVQAAHKWSPETPTISSLPKARPVLEPPSEEAGMGEVDISACPSQRPRCVFIVPVGTGEQPPV